MLTVHLPSCIADQKTPFIIGVKHAQPVQFQEESESAKYRRRLFGWEILATTYLRAKDCPQNRIKKESSVTTSVSGPITPTAKCAS